MPEPITPPVPAAPATPAAPVAPVAPVAQAVPAPPATAPTSTPAAPATAEPNATPWSDPAAAEAEIKRLRAENGAARTNAKAQAAEEARKELAQSIAKILDPDATEPTDDPAKLTESLTTSQAEAKQARAELAVFRNADAAGGDPAALLDSASFLASLAAVDPADAAAVTAAIQAAVTANPRLGAAPIAPAIPGAPAPNPAQGASGNGGPSLEAQIAEASKAGNHALAITLKRQLAAATS